MLSIDDIVKVKMRINGSNTQEEKKNPDTSDATATADDIRFGKTAYAKGVKLTGTLSSATGVYF